MVKRHHRGLLTVTGLAVAMAWCTSVPAIARAAAPSCQTGDVFTLATEMSPGMGHRGVQLQFSLAPSHASCTLTGYPGVDTGSGGPLLHAERTLSGYLGGAPNVSTVTLNHDRGAVAVVEGVAFDASGDQCPTYTDLLVTTPNTTDTVVVNATIATCALQVHPVTASS